MFCMLWLIDINLCHLILLVKTTNRPWAIKKVKLISNWVSKLLRAHFIGCFFFLRKLFSLCLGNIVYLYSKGWFFTLSYLTLGQTIYCFSWKWNSSSLYMQDIIKTHRDMWQWTLKHWLPSSKSNLLTKRMTTGISQLQAHRDDAKMHVRICVRMEWWEPSLWAEESR